MIVNVSTAGKAPLQKTATVLVLHYMKCGSLDAVQCGRLFLVDMTSKQCPRLFFMLSLAVAEVKKSSPCLHFTLSGPWQSS